ncbi:MAG: hypothetical protein KAJ19_15220 [Gammaproteobacteria bacterium]|nr:hypothetical protein [Gammaproteobacteria bacterium]
MKFLIWKCEATNVCHRSVDGRRSEAFSIIEAIIALIIMSTAMMAIFGAIRASSGAAQHSRMQTKAVLLAETKLAETRLSGPGSYAVTSGQEDSYSWEVRIDPTSIKNLGSVDIRVAWSEQGRNQEFKLTSFLQMKTFEQTMP